MVKIDRKWSGYLQGLLIALMIYIDVTVKKNWVSVICLGVVLAIDIALCFFEKEKYTTINGKEVDLSGLEISSEKDGKNVKISVCVSKGCRKDVAEVIEVLRDFTNPNKHMEMDYE